MEEAKQELLYVIQSIDSLEINNFKSFGGNQDHYSFVGPFLKFTSIVGPNGGGKSNIIDAICFVLGITTASLRSSSLKELVFRSSAQSINELQNQHQQCSVSLNLNQRKRDNRSEEKQISSINNILKLCRSIEKDNKQGWQSHYFINNIEKNLEEYEQFLISNSIIPQAKNFLMMQGETDCLATLKPEKLTEYFEKVSQSRSLAKRYEDVQKELEEVKTQIAQNTVKLNQLKSDKRKMKQIRQTSTEYSQLIKEIEQLETKLHLLQFLRCDTQLLELSKDYHELQVEREQKTQTRSQQVLQLQTEEKKLKKQWNEVAQLKEELAQHKQKLLELKQSCALIDKQILQHQQQQSQDGNLVLKQKELIEKQSEEKEIKEKLQEFRKEIKVLEQYGQGGKEGEKEEQQLEQKIGKEQFIEFQDLRKQVRVKGFQIQQEVTKLRNQSQTSALQLEAFQGEIKAQQDLVIQLKQQQAQVDDQIGSKLKQIQENKSEVDRLTKREKELGEEMSRTAEKRGKVTELKERNERLLRQQEIVMQTYNEEIEGDEIVQEIKRSVKGCVGTLSQLVSATAVKYELPVKLAFGPALNYVVVHSSNDAKLCNEFLKSRGYSKELLILDNIPSSNNEYESGGEDNNGQEEEEDKEGGNPQHYKKGSTENRQAILRKEFQRQSDKLIYDVIEFDRNIPNLDQAFLHFLGGKVCCENIQRGFKLRNSGMLRHLIRQIITLDGNIINVSGGVITAYGGGESQFQHHSKKKLSNKERKQELESKLEELKTEILKNIDTIEGLQSSSVESELKQLSSDLSDKRSNVNALYQQVEDVLKPHKLQLEQQESTCNASLRQLQLKLQNETQDNNTIMKRVEKMQLEMRDLSQKFFQGFCQKVKVDFNKDIAPLLNIISKPGSSKGKKGAAALAKEGGGEGINNTNDDIVNQIEQHYRQYQKVSSCLEDLERKLKQLDLQKLSDEVTWMKEQQQKQNEQGKALKTQSARANEDRQKSEIAIQKLTQQIQQQEQATMQIEQQQKEEITRLRESKQQEKQFEMSLLGLRHDMTLLLQKKFSLLEEARIRGIIIPLMQQPSQIEYSLLSQLKDEMDFDENRKSIHLDYQTLHLEKLKGEGVDIGREAQERMKEETSQQMQSTQSDDEISARGINEKLLDKEEENLGRELAEKSIKLEAMSSRAREEVDTEWDQNENKIKGITEKLDDLVLRQKASEEMLLQVREQRKSKFLKLFDPVKLIINEIYQMLSKTKSDIDNNDAYIAGSALLYLENAEEPFNGGVIFSPTPPRKTFVFDTEAQLSGGEKTMASLALFLAVNLVVKTPFLIFDEVDEYLDGNNTNRYTEVLQQFMKQRGVQCILITHKDTVFESSESLVGVTINRKTCSSICYSLDLREQIQHQQQLMI